MRHQPKDSPIPAKKRHGLSSHGYREWQQWIQASAISKHARADVSDYPPHELRLAVDFFFAFFFAEKSLIALFALRSVLVSCGPPCAASGLSVATAGAARPTQPAAAKINVSFLICSSIAVILAPTANARMLPAFL
jgi:hypothetical protein